MPEQMVTLHDVEILKVGNWASALSGRVPVTDADIADMVAAAQDPEVDHAPLKIGHIDPRFDGEPALGWLANVRAVGGTLLADITDVPAKLAATVQAAFRRRSAEIAWAVKTPSGKTYRAALSGLALLGVTPPAVKGLADIMSRYSAPPSESVGAVVTIDGDTDTKAVAMAAALSGVAGFAAALDGDPSQTRALAALELLSATSASIGRPPSDHGDRDPHPPQGGAMTDEQIRTLFGLAADAPITDQMRTVATERDAAAKTKADADKAAADAAKAKADADAKAVADKAKADAEAAAKAAGTLTTIDAAALADLQAKAAAGESARAELDTQERERELAAALSGGRIAPASMEQWRAQWDANKTGTKALLASLPAAFSTVITELGSSGDTSALSGGADDTKWDDFLGSLGPDFVPKKGS